MNDDRDLMPPSDPVQLRLGDVRATLGALRSGTLGPLNDIQQTALVLLESEIGRLDRELESLVGARSRRLAHRLAAAFRRVIHSGSDDRAEERRYCVAGAIG